MSPKIGRPTDEPKKLRLELRLSDNDKLKLEICCKTFDLTQAEVLRRGLDKVYQDAQRQK